MATHSAWIGAIEGYAVPGIPEKGRCYGADGRVRGYPGSRQKVGQVAYISAPSPVATKRIVICLEVGNRYLCHPQCPSWALAVIPKPHTPPDDTVRRIRAARARVHVARRHRVPALLLVQVDASGVGDVHALAPAAPVIPLRNDAS